MLTFEAALVGMAGIKVSDSIIVERIVRLIIFSYVIFLYNATN